VGDAHYLALALPRRGLVLTIHDCAALDRLKGAAREILRQFWFVRPMRHARIVTTISQAMRDELRQRFGDLAANVRIIPNCVRSEFVPTPKPFPSASPVILQVGTGWNKNVERVAEALRGISCRLDIVGTLSATQRGLLGNAGIVFRELGRLSDDEVLEAYKACDIVAFASLYEGFGMPIVEAQAIGRPVVTSRFGAMAEAAGRGALLVNPLEILSLREAVKSLCSNPALREKLVSAGFENLARFRAGAVAASYAAVYEEVCSNDAR